MPNKTTRARRDGKPRVNEAQLQAYRRRKAETVAQHDVAPEKTTTSGTRPAMSSGVVTAWGHVGEEYDMIKSDLVRLFIITGLMLVIIIVLWFFLA